MATGATAPTLFEVVDDALSRRDGAGRPRNLRRAVGFGPDPSVLSSLKGFGGPESVLGAASPAAPLDAAGHGLDDAAFMRAVDSLAADALAEALTLGGSAPVRSGGERLLYMAGAADRPPTLVLMIPDDAPSKGARLATPEDLPLDRLTETALSDAWARVARAARDGADRDAARLIGADAAADGAALMADVLGRAGPEVVITRLPRMERLCAPWPHLPVECGGQRSTAGVFAHDADGVLGVTCCFHGTGPVGTVVTIGLRDYVVTRASEVQDTVFVAMPGFNLPDLAGLAGARVAAPGQGDRARFDGATNRQRDTVVQSHDAGLLRRRPGVQLKVQTRPDTDRGDSGSALIDADDRVVGFAFEKTAFDDWPQFTDWIWAANALDALGLTPLAPAPPPGG
jgi:hypothetical protein